MDSQRIRGGNGWDSELGNRDWRPGLRKNVQRIRDGNRAVLRSLAMIFFATCFNAVPDSLPGTNETTVTIYHTSDIHECSDNLSRIAHFVRERKREDRNVLFLDSGDWFDADPYFPDSADLISLKSRGEPMIALLGACGYDACIFGNHDMSFDMNRVIDWVDRYQIPILAANCEWIRNVKPKSMEEYRIFELEGIRVAVIGTAAEPASKPYNDLVRTLIVEDSIKDLVPALRKQADIIILITHLGDARDKQIAQAVPGIDLIVGGHYHHTYRETVFDAGSRTVIQHSGSSGQVFGEVVFRWDGEKIVSHQTRIIDIDSHMPEDANVKALRAKYFACPINPDLPLVPVNELKVEPEDGAEVPDTRSATDPFADHDGKDLSIPNATRIKWAFKTDYPEPSFDLFLSEDRPAFIGKPVASNIENSEFSLWNLKKDTRYYWKLVVKSGGREIAESPAFRFRTPALWPRWIRIDGTTNVRDLGGTVNVDRRATRQGLIYRSSEFDSHCAITPDGTKAVLDLGIRTHIDLRLHNDGPTLPPEIHYLNIPVSGYDAGLQTSEASIRDFFKVLANTENYPIIFHCWGGADRGGTVALLLEAVLNWPEEMIARDYEWTSLSIWGQRRRTSQEYAWQQTLDMLKAFDPENNSLHAGTRNYLRKIGVTDDELSAIREIFLEPAH
jgi:hypothetical protein